MVAALNNQSPLAAVTELFTSKGVDEGVTQSVLAKIDPLNPENMDVDSVLDTAQAMVGANIPSIQERYLELTTRGEDNLTPSGYKSIFSNKFQNKVKGLAGLNFGKRPEVKDKPKGKVMKSSGGIEFKVK